MKKKYNKYNLNTGKITYNVDPPCTPLEDSSQQPAYVALSNVKKDEYGWFQVFGSTGDDEE